jgi:GTPase
VAVDEADALILVTDGQEGLTGADAEILQWLRRHHSKKPIHLAVNKCENVQKAELQVRFFPLIQQKVISPGWITRSVP